MMYMMKKIFERPLEQSKKKGVLENLQDTWNALSQERKWNYTKWSMILLWILFCNYILILHHEPWRDEAQSWLIARDLSLPEIWRTLSYEGHPILWYLILLPFAKLGVPYIWNNLIALVVVMIGCFFLVFKSPFDSLQKIAVLISPVCLYCFSVIGRSYCLCFLFPVLLAWFYSERLKHPFIYCIIIGLMVQVHIIMLGMAFALCVVQLFDAFTEWKRSEDALKNEVLLQRLLALVIPLVSALLLLAEFSAVKDAQSYPMDLSNKSIPEICGTVFSSFTEYAPKLFGQSYFLILLLCVDFFVWSIFCQRAVVKHFFVLCFSVYYQLFVYTMVYGNDNYRIVTWLCFVIWFVWVSAETVDQKKIFGKLLNYLILVIACFSAVWLYTSESRTDYEALFSDAENTARFIENNIPEDAVIFENDEDFCNAVIPFLRRHTIYTPSRKTKAGYCDRNKNVMVGMDYEQFIQIVREMFPDIQGVYVLCAQAGNGRVNGLMDYPHEELYTSSEWNWKGEIFKVIYISF